MIPLFLRSIIISLAASVSVTAVPILAFSSVSSSSSSLIVGGGGGSFLGSSERKRYNNNNGVVSSITATSLLSSSTPSQSSVDMNTPARQSLPDNLRLVLIPGKGLGIITNEKIPAGTVVGDYQGEIMTEDVKDRRYLKSCEHLRLPMDEEWIKSRLERSQTITGAYLYGIDIPNKKTQLFVDAEDEYCSLWTRFLNHASPPGNNVNPKSLYQGMDGNPRVWFVSNRDIDIDEEICFNYGDDYWLPEDNIV